MQDHAGAAGHGRAALPVLERLGARDDLVQLAGLLALGAIAEGRLDDAEDELREIDRGGPVESIFGGRPARAMGGAELLLARGRRVRSAGLPGRGGRADADLPGMDPTGMEPWIVFAESAPGGLRPAPRRGRRGQAPWTAAVASASPGRCGRTTRTWTTPSPGSRCSRSRPGRCAGTRPTTRPPRGPCELLVLADRFAYSRAIPSMAWAPIAAQAGRAPGRVAVMRRDRGLRGPALLRARARGRRGSRSGPLGVAAHREWGSVATTTAEASRVQPTSAVIWPLLARSRVAETRCRPG